MKCNCIDKVENDLSEKLKSKHPDRTYRDLDTWSSDGIANTGYNIEAGTTSVYFPFELRYTVPLKNGEPSAIRKHKVNLFPTFCPFCGINLTEEENVEPIEENAPDQITSESTGDNNN